MKATVLPVMILVHVQMSDQNLVLPCMFDRCRCIRVSIVKNTAYLYFFGFGRFINNLNVSFMKAQGELSPVPLCWLVRRCRIKRRKITSMHTCRPHYASLAYRVMLSLTVMQLLRLFFQCFLLQFPLAMVTQFRNNKRNS